MEDDMGKRTIALHDLGFTEYFEESTLDVDADKYDVVISELNKLMKRIGRRKWKGITRYDRKRLKAAIQGFCWNCGKFNNNNTVATACKKCEEKLNTRNYKRRCKLQEEHKCITCSAPVAIEDNSIRCPNCADRFNTLRKKRRHSRKTRDLCIECGKKESLPNHNFCAPCYFKRKSRKMFGTNDKWQELRSLWDEQEGICPYTNKRMILGQNASLDHKYPRGRFPELMCDVHNLEWIDKRINSMKYNRTPMEFLEYLQNIINNYKTMLFADLDIVNNCESMIENYISSK